MQEWHRHVQKDVLKNVVIFGKYQTVSSMRDAFRTGKGE